MGVLQAGVEGGDFFGGGFAAGEAAVGDVVACVGLGELVLRFFLGQATYYIGTCMVILLL